MPVALCRIKYYNNCLFHNVQRNFIAQTGDPTATGRGGDSVYGCVCCWAGHWYLQHCINRQQTPALSPSSTAAVLTNDSNLFAWHVRV